MTRADVVLLLGLAATYDYRKTGQADVEAWFLAVGDLPLDEAKAAVIAHYRDSTDRMMPAHVRRGVKAIRAERARLEPSVPRQLPSRFEDDMGRQVRLKQGAATVREVLGSLLDHLAEQRQGELPASAVEELRAITAGPGWVADGDVAVESEARP